MAIRNFATEAYGPGGGGVLIPRNRFNFTIVFLTDDQNVQITRVSNVTVPSYSFDTLVANQYNKLRVVQTRMNYDPITMTFYDTHDSQFHNLLKEYIAFYYHSRNGIDERTLTEGIDTTISKFTTDRGFTPNPDRYYFKKIQIIQNGMNGKINKYRETILINPIITSIGGDTLDYNDSQPVMHTITFQPESVQVEERNGRFRVDTSSSPINTKPAPNGGGDRRRNHLGEFNPFRA